MTPARCRACRLICASDICGWSAAAEGRLAMSSPAIPATPGGLCGIKFRTPRAIDATMFPFLRLHDGVEAIAIEATMFPLPRLLDGVEVIT